MNKVNIEFHNTLASLGVRLWQLIPKAVFKKKNEKAWENTVKEVRWMVRSRLHVYGYTECKWDEQYDKTFISPLRDEQQINIKKKYNKEHYEEERANLEKFRADMEALLAHSVPQIYEDQLTKT